MFIDETQAPRHFQYIVGAQHILGFPDSSVGKESTCNAGDPGSIPGSGRSSGEGIGYTLLYSWASLVAQLVRKERLPTPVFWPGEFHGLYNPWNHKEMDTAE